MQDILNVQCRLVEFVEAARVSDEPYTVRDLQEMVELELMAETGGLLNWVKRKLTGIDDDALAEIKAGVDSIATEEDRQKALRTIDQLLKECEELAGRSAGRHAATAVAGTAALKLSGIFGDQGLLGKAVTGTAKGIGLLTGRMLGSVFGAVIPGLKDGGAKGALVLGKVGEYAVAAYGAVKIAQVIARIYVAKDGTMDDYIAALRAVRKEIESKKLA
jgi:hypothetical protein